MNSIVEFELEVLNYSLEHILVEMRKEDLMRKIYRKDGMGTKYKISVKIETLGILP
jgi:hypothetical protein